MAWGSFGLWARSVPHRIRSIPWGSMATEAFGRCFLVVKFGCFIHVTNNYIFGVVLVQGPSMLPTINLSGDVLLVERISPHLGKVSVGDVVLVQSPENPLKIVTKRVTGLEGDSVTFLVDPIRGERSRTVVVPKGHVWVAGDNIYQSRDSRQFGAVPYGLVKGKAFCRVWPPEGFELLKKTSMHQTSKQLDEGNL
uniref:Mitochondrial inner membrane protease subunit 1 n=2 Tax=Anthurium amnicola TaxID=1678845 RepID=A0A1D1YAU3_9ARAE